MAEKRAPVLRAESVYRALRRAIIEQALKPGMLGLFLGKQIGVFGFGWLAIRAGLADLPAKASWA